MPDEEVDKPAESDWFLVEGPASEEEFFPELPPAEPLQTIVAPPGLGATPPADPGPAPEPGGPSPAEDAGTPPSQGEPAPAPAAAAPAEPAPAAELVQASMPESAAPEAPVAEPIPASKPNPVAPGAPAVEAPVVAEPVAEPLAAPSAEEPAAATPEGEPEPAAASTPPEGEAAPPPPPDVRPALPEGIRRADALRIGGNEAVAPRLLTALFVIVRTPQRVRLGQIVPLREARTLIGRGRGVGFFLDDVGAADVHAVVTHQETSDGPGFYLYASEFNPPRINGMPADVRTRLHDGDRVEIGSTQFVYREIALGREGS